MGRGDKKTRKGKRTAGSFGVSRRNVKEIKARLKRACFKEDNKVQQQKRSLKRPRKKAEA
jgi:ribosomal small subunit protein bTHX